MFFDPHQIKSYILSIWAVTLVLALGMGGVMVWAIIKLVNHFAP